MPKVEPALWQASAALRKVSRVQFSAFGSLPAGYIACTSMPACCFIRSMREHGPLIWLPTVAGTPSQRSLSRPRYSTVPLTLPFCLISSVMRSLTGSRESACCWGHQVGKAKISWPAFACPSAAMVRRFLFPCDVMKSIFTSTFSLSAQARTMSSVALLAPGTQWSQKPIDRLPAAFASRTNGAATNVDAAAVVCRKRRRVTLSFAMDFPPVGFPTHRCRPPAGTSRASDRRGRRSCSELRTACS